MNKVKKIKNLVITSFALFLLTDYSYKLIKGEKKANAIVDNHLYSKNHIERVVAHRGFSGMYPENSLESINEALKLECVDMIEIDIRFTKNNIFVIHHDSFISFEELEIKIEDLELDELDEELIINNYPLYNLNNMLYDDTLFLFKRFLKSINEEGELIKLKKVLNNYNFEKPLLLDVKTDNVNTNMIESLNNLIKNYKDKVFIQSDYFPFLDNMIKLYPDYKYLYIVKSDESLKHNNSNFYGYTVKYSMLDKMKIDNSKIYLVYTINSNQKYTNLLNSRNYNNDMYVITDNPDYICALGSNKKLRK